MGCTQSKQDGPASVVHDSGDSHLDGKAGGTHGGPGKPVDGKTSSSQGINGDTKGRDSLRDSQCCSIGDIHTRQSDSMSQLPAANTLPPAGALPPMLSAVHNGKSEDRGSSRSSGPRNVLRTRSSFAMDASLDGPLGPQAGKNRQTFEQLRVQPSAAAVGAAQIPPSLKKPLSRLVVVPNDTPVPANMLQKLWQMPSQEETTKVIQALQHYGMLRVAQLDDGSTWCLVANTSLQQLQVTYGDLAPTIHGELLDAYACSAAGGSALQVRDIPDDGYIMQNVAYHLVESGRVNTLRNLLGEPAWLEAKLHSYGTAPVVSDFRRYLAEAPDDMGARLLLQALQLSLGCCAEHPSIHMLREQMLARLMTVVHDAPPSSRSGQQPQRQGSGQGDGAFPAQGGATRGTQHTASPQSAPLTGYGAAGGSSHGGGIPRSAVSSVGPSQGEPGSRQDSKSNDEEGLVPASGQATLRDSARMSGVTSVLRQWFEYQSSRAVMDIVTAAGYACVHLMPRSASLKQAGGMQRMILRGHKGPIRKVVISPNGQDVVTVSDDGSAQVWDMNVGDCVMQLARQQPLSDVDVAAGGCLCVVASVDGAACVWDVSTGTVKHVLRGHTSKINSVAIDRLGSTCVTASDDRSVRVWSIDKGQCRAVLAGHGKTGGGSIEFGLVFDVALSADGGLAATASEDFTCRVWDLDDNKCMHVLEGHSGWVVSVRFIGESTHLITASHDSTARIWDGIRGKCLHVLTGHTGRLNRVVVDSTGQYAVTCSDDGTARVWEVEEGTCRSVLERHEAWVADASITRGGQRCVTVGGDGLVCVWDTHTGQLQACLEGHSEALRSVVLTGGGRFAVSAGDDGTACVWDLSMSYAANNQARKHSSRILALHTLCEGRQVVSACEGGRVVAWDVATCKPTAQLDTNNGAAVYLGVSKDSRLVISGSANRRVTCWELPGGKQCASLPPQQGSRVKHMAFSATGTCVAMVLYDSTTSVWDIMTGQLVAQLMGRGERVGRNVHTGGVNGILLCGRGPHAASHAVTWSKDCTARVWEVATAQVKLVLEGHTEGIQCACLNADESILATSSYGLCVRLHMMEDGSPLAVLDHAAPATRLSFSPNGRLLAVVLDNHSVVVWDLVAHNCLAPLQAHKAEITSLAFSPDGLVLATCSQDCTARVWDAHSGREIAMFVADAATTTCCFAGAMPNAADILVVGDAGGATHFLDLPPELQPGNAPSY